MLRNRLLIIAGPLFTIILFTALILPTFQKPTSLKAATLTNPSKPLSEAAFTATDVQERAVPGELLLKLQDKASVAKLRQDPEIEQVIPIGSRTMSHLNLYAVKLKNKTPNNTVQTFRKLVDSVDFKTGNIKSLSYNHRTRLQAIPNDPKFSEDGQWGLRAIQAPLAWDKVTGTDTDPKIFATVIDTGVDMTHPDLFSNLKGNYLELHGNPNDDDDGNGIVDDVYGAGINDDLSLRNTPQYIDNDTIPACQSLNPAIENHGTFVSSIIGAVGNNNIGISGINWRTRILNFNDSTETCNMGSAYALFEGLDYANFANAPVVNYSAIFDFNPTDSIVTEMDEAIATYTHDSQGKLKALFINSAGNDQVNLDTYNRIRMPCESDNEGIICITGTEELPDEPKKEIFYSQFAYGAQSVDLAAPGYYLEVTSIDPQERYLYAEGTSLAAPYVTGTVLLLMQANPNLSMAQIRDIILATVDTPKEIPSFGLAAWPNEPQNALEGKVRTNGRLNLARAVTCAQDPQLSCLKAVWLPVILKDY